MLWIKGSKAQEADACRKIVHFRHTLVKFLKPFFSRSFGAVNLKKHVCVGSPLRPRKAAAAMLQAFTLWAKAATGGAARSGRLSGAVADQCGIGAMARPDQEASL
ncbi:hypothetical protein [Pseudomonas sp. EA_105y_Pfl2_R69]|jgi:hypothetical protein|uniref:hypothetical protein n=1 Tax=Pseudomonas sp. EA_105y_Pfl2_R69 TaxID=3088683 RepID=UPI0030D73B5A